MPAVGTKTVPGVQGSPYRPPFGSFAGKPATAVTKHVSVMGVQGAPFRPPFASFVGKPPSAGAGVIILRTLMGTGL